MPNWMPTPPQYTWSQHPEFATHDTAPRSFILAKTKFRAYNAACASFLDVVEDEICCAGAAPCLRLRIGSRRQTSLNILPLKDKAPSNKPDFADHVQYENGQIRMWPPAASNCPCSKNIHDILNPPLPLGPRQVTGVLDERALVIIVKPSRGYRGKEEMGRIVVVDFTRSACEASRDMDAGEH